jgi:hypothetical protein
MPINPLYLQEPEEEEEEEEIEVQLYNNLRNGILCILLSYTTTKCGMSCFLSGHT